MFGRIGVPELLIILVIILLLFGVGRVSKISSELGKSFRAFKDGLSGDKNEDDQDSKKQS